MALGVFSVSASAAEVDTDHLMFPEDVAEAVAMAEEAALLNRSTVQTANQQDYAAEKPWVGATKVEKPAHGQAGCKK